MWNNPCLPENRPPESHWGIGAEFCKKGAQKTAGGLFRCSPVWVSCLAMRRLAMLVMTAAVTVIPVTLGAPAHATTIDCKHTGPVVGHPGMEYICYVHHPGGHMETFFAPGPYAGP
jgi:hypothetical protein